MTKKKTTTQQTQTQNHNQATTSNQSFNNTNVYDWLNPPDNDDVRAVRGFQFQVDPSIGYAFGSARNQIANSFSSPIGGYYSPQIKDRVLRSSLSDLAQREGQIRSEANNNLQGQRFNQAVTVAGMTAPRLVQTGSSGSSTGTGTSSGTGSSSGSGTTTQSGGLLEAMLLSGVQGASSGAAA